MKHLSGLVMLFFTLFPQVLAVITSLIGVQVLSNALFAILFFCMLIILISLTAINSKQNESINRLVQQNALLEKRIRELEKNEVMLLEVTRYGKTDFFHYTCL